MTNFRIDGRPVGRGKPVYFIAEISANHNQDYRSAERHVRAARDAGADAVKLQTYTPQTMTIDSDRPCFRIQGTLWKGRTLYDLYGEAYTPWKWHKPLKRLAEKLGLSLFSTPFDETAVDFLEGLRVPAHKIASFENVDLPLLRKVAATGKPVIMSTGMSTRRELDEAVAALRRAGARNIALLKCTSAYPAKPEDMNLRTIPDMSARYGLPVGLSDHTLGSDVAIAAAALGACIVEKHLIVSRRVASPDSAFSMEPAEFRRMVDSVRLVERSLGRVSYEPGPHERDTRRLRRSLFVVQDMNKGDEFTPQNVRRIRPGQGLLPREYERVLGRRAARDLSRGTPLAWEHVAGGVPPGGRR